MPAHLVKTMKRPVRREGASAFVVRGVYACDGLGRAPTAVAHFMAHVKVFLLAVLRGNVFHQAGEHQCAIVRSDTGEVLGIRRVHPGTEVDRVIRHGMLNGFRREITSGHAERSPFPALWVRIHFLGHGVVCTCGGVIAGGTFEIGKVQGCRWEELRVDGHHFLVDRPGFLRHVALLIHLTEVNARLYELRVFFRSLAQLTFRAGPILQPHALRAAFVKLDGALVLGSVLRRLRLSSWQ
jgi:hypothetical protein